MEMPERTGSLYGANSQKILLKCIQKCQLERFQQILATDEHVDVNYWYDDPENGTLLDICCMKENCGQFIEVLLKHGADPNLINKIRKKGPIHLAVERHDIKTLSILLKCKHIQVNLIDSFGNTPLHLSVKTNNSTTNETKCLQLLLSHSDINVNIANRKGQTASHIAASQSNKDALLLLLMKSDIDLDSSKDPAGKTARNIIEQKFSEIMLPKQTGIENISPEKLLFDLIRNNDVIKFKELLYQNKNLVNTHDGLYTLIQYSAAHGLTDFVEVLIEAGADINDTPAAIKETALLIASRKGYPKIVHSLMNNEKVSYSAVDSETVLHNVVNGSLERQCLGEEDVPRDHLKCLNLFLHSNAKNSINLNQGDGKGNTALHCAGKIGNEEMTASILDAGAYVGMVNKMNEPAIAYITPSTFQQYLDRCIQHNDKFPREEGYEIIFNYKSFVPPKTNNLEFNVTNSKSERTQFLSETDLLLYLSKSPDLKTLLDHPILKSLIYLKWYNIRKLFYINVLFYLLFWLTLSIYILGIYETKVPKMEAVNNETNKEINSPQGNNKVGSFWFIVVFLLSVLILRELFQLKKSFAQYVLDFENWIEVCLIGVTIAVLFSNADDQSKQQLAAAAILLSWTELVLIIGKHPNLSTNIEMLKTVAWNFLKFLSWYSILIVAFALSFYTLFRDTPDTENNVFLDPGVSIFKTVVMLTGEFDAGDIHFDEHPVASHFLFVLFVFSIAMVLYNLLNGLAVSDTQAIKSDAEMVGYISRIKLVAYIESIDPTPCNNLQKLRFSSLFNSCLTSNDDPNNDSFSWQKKFFSLMSEHEIHIFPNEQNKIELPSSSFGLKRNENLEENPTCFLNPARCGNIFMDSVIVKAAQAVLNKKNSEVNLKRNQKSLSNDDLLIQYQQVLQDYKYIVDKMLQNEKTLTTSINTLLEDLRSKKNNWI